MLQGRQSSVGRRLFILALLTAASLLVIPQHARAAAATYQAKKIRQSSSAVAVQPGKRLTFWVEFQNTGTATWRNSGPNRVALNLIDPAGRRSPFQDRTWSASYRPAVLRESEVKPGETGRFTFILNATKTPIERIERFQIASRGIDFIKNGTLDLLVRVGTPKSSLFETKPDAANPKTLTLAAGETKEISFTYTNRGSRTWTNSGRYALGQSIIDGSDAGSIFWSASWHRPTRPAYLSETSVKPGEKGTITYTIRAPAVEGTFTHRVQLSSDGLAPVHGSGSTLTITVVKPQTLGATENPVAVPGEPNVRIGLTTFTEPVKLSADGSFEISTSKDEKLFSLPGNALATISYSSSGGTYSVSDGTTTKTTVDPVRMVPLSTATIAEAVNFENRPAWNHQLNDNRFRGVLEVRFTPANGKLWLINELPIEGYLRGLAEVSNGQPEEYLKSLIIAARSYAIWHLRKGTKHADENYTINATSDQIYRGFGFESRSIDPLRAVEATKGIVITHPAAVFSNNPDGVALAAYSSGTDGRTRSFLERWGTDFPWSVSVEDPYGVIDNALTLSGNHMVGLSAAGARGFATKENRTFDWILQYYYTGVALKKLY